ncbi:MAG TPA: hypothetical protein VES67_00535 [Vicinamibacterales bacterium]|nr:hypothetical protein [Vicinamibacterales bacterium]
MRRLSSVVVILGTFAVAGPAVAQQTPIPTPSTSSQQTTPPPGRQSQTVSVEPAPPRAPALPSITANVKLDLIITDTYTGTPVKKTVSMLILNGSNGMIRTANRLATGSNVGLNIDAAAMIHQGGFITVRVTFEYTPAQVPPNINPSTREQIEAIRTQQAERGLSPTSQPAELHESLSVILQDGKPLLVSQSADPTTDRKVTVELMATVLK